MRVGDLVSLKKYQKSVRLVNFGCPTFVAGYVDVGELCLVIMVTPPASSTWGRIKVLGSRGNIGWVEDGLFTTISSLSKL